MKKPWAMVVDGDAKSRRSVGAFFNRVYPEGRVIECENGSEALVKARRQKFDLVITEITLPRMDGMSLVEDLLTMEPQAFRPEHILVISSDRNEPDSGWFTKKQVSFLPKPVQSKDILDYFQVALNPVKSAPKKIDPKVYTDLINPFIDATIEVLRVTCKVESMKDSVFMRDECQISGDISAVVAMNSSDHRGSMAVAFEKGCFLYIVSNMLDEKIDELTEDIQDAAGEISNQIFGIAKKVLNENGHDIQSALPSVIVGDSHSIKHLVTGDCIAVKFATPGGSFIVEAVVSEK